MVRELGRFCCAMLIVLVMSHHYFRADMMEWENTTVITVKTLAFDVETLEVRRKKDECVFNVSNINDWLIIKILVDYYKIVIGSFIPLLTSVTAYPFLQTFLPGICAANIACLLYFDYNFSRSTCCWP